jgi:hypothetical protein
MQLRIIIALLSLLNVSPALACSRPDGAPILSNEEIVKITKERIARADVIVDGIVIEEKDDRVFLKPIKVWKGKPLRRYYIANSGCDVFLSGRTKVRGLLEGESIGLMMMAPLGENRLKTQLYDSLIDAYLGQVRPADFENGGLAYPPLP